MEPHEPPASPVRHGRLVVGLVVVAVGVAILLDTLAVDVPWGIVLPAAVILVGLMLLLNPRSASFAALVTLGTIMTVVLLATSLVDQPFGWGTPDTIEQADFVVADRVERIVVTVDAGAVEILAWSGDTIEVERELKFDNERPRVDHTLVNGVLEIVADCPGVFFAIGSSCSVDHLLRVPASVDVHIDTGAGSVHVTGLDGMVLANTGSGGIELVNLSGRVTAETGSGGIVVERMSGTADLSTGSGSIRGTGVASLQMSAETGSGSINLGFGSAPDDLDLVTGSGSITLTVPTGSYRLDLDTNSGRWSSSGITDDAASPRIIRARTGSGSIRVDGE
ncbi:MAG: DUF4097 family beta strand repeat-containing protein [Acidimicrobiia bacterium]